MKKIFLSISLICFISEAYSYKTCSSHNTYEVGESCSCGTGSTGERIGTCVDAMVDTGETGCSFEDMCKHGLTIDNSDVKRKNLKRE